MPRASFLNSRLVRRRKASQPSGDDGTLSFLANTQTPNIRATVRSDRACLVSVFSYFYLSFFIAG